MRLIIKYNKEGGVPQSHQNFFDVTKQEEVMGYLKATYETKGLDCFELVLEGRAKISINKETMHYKLKEVDIIRPFSMLAANEILRLEFDRERDLGKSGLAKLAVVRNSAISLGSDFQIINNNALSNIFAGAIAFLPELSTFEEDKYTVFISRHYKTLIYNKGVLTLWNRLSDKIMEFEVEPAAAAAIFNVFISGDAVVQSMYKYIPSELFDTIMELA